MTYVQLRYQISRTARYLISLLLLTSAPTIGAGEIRAGVAEEQFALPKGVPLAGYSKRHGKPSQGEHDPVGVRALVLSDGQTTVAFASCDLLIIDEHLFDAIRQRVIASGLPKATVLLIAATHTHSGPGAYGKQFLEKLSMGHFDAAVFERLVDTISATVLKASAQREPVRYSYGATPVDGVSKNRVDAHGLVDRDLTAVGIYSAATQQPMSALVNFSAHPTSLGAWNRQLSADYPGVLMHDIEQRLPGTTAFFFAGSVGDQAPVKQGTGFERAEWIGAELARQALALVPKASPQPPSRLAALQERMPLPTARVRLGMHLPLPRWLGQSLVDDDATLTVIRVGGVVFFGAPCDLSAELGQRLKQAARAKGLEPMVIGFANDYIGYCMPSSVYQAGAYESLMAFNGPDTGELLVQRLIQMLDEVVIQ